MAKLEILLPAMGEGIIEATITKWLVNVGDKVEEDQSIVEVATDKVDSEIPSPKNGIVEKLLFSENDIPKVGDTIAIINTNSSGKTVDKTESIKTKDVEIKSADIPEESIKIEEKISNSSNVTSLKTPGGKFLSPLVRSIAEKENVDIDELDKIKGTSNTGRITKSDIINYIYEYSCRISGF